MELRINARFQNHPNGTGGVVRGETTIEIQSQNTGNDEAGLNEGFLQLFIIVF